MKRTPMTLRGAAALRAELKRLKSESRPSVIKAIAEARGHGDLSENAEYHAAREQQGFIEGRIMEIESRLSAAEIIDVLTLPLTGRVVTVLETDPIRPDVNSDLAVNDHREAGDPHVHRLGHRGPDRGHRSVGHDDAPTEGLGAFAPSNTWRAQRRAHRN